MANVACMKLLVFEFGLEKTTVSVALDFAFNCLLSCTVELHNIF